MSSRKRKVRMTVVANSGGVRKPAARKRTSKNIFKNCKTFKSFMCKFWNTLIANLRSVSISRPPRRLRVCESISLGEKRVIAVVQFEQQRFLLGASANSINLLSNLPSERSFGSTFQNCAVLQAKLDEVIQEEVKVAL